MNIRALALVVLLGCTRAREATDAGSPLDGCKSETKDQSTTWECGSGFLAMDATLDRPASSEEIRENLAAFRAESSKETTKLETSERARTIRGAEHPAVLLRFELPERGKFVAMMVVLRLAKTTRILTCSARASDEARCDAVIGELASRAMSAP